MHSNDNCIGRRIFIAGLNRLEDPNALKQILMENFERFGKICDVYVPTDWETGSGRGIAFVTFDDEQSAQQAISEMEAQEMDGKTIHVQLARPKSRRQ